MLFFYKYTHNSLNNEEREEISNLMILSVSRRTDIPCCYAEWFMNRIKEGYLYIRNPLYPEKVSKINLSPDVIDCIVFWTKDSSDFNTYLDELSNYNYYFQYTINGYETDVEPEKTLKNDPVKTFQELSKKIGKKRVIWRYDPILLNEKYTIDRHIKIFDELAKQLSAYTEKVVISFIDMYGSVIANTSNLNLKPITMVEMEEIAKSFSEIGKKYHMQIETCAETADFSKYGIQHGHCIDKDFIENLIGYKLTGGKDKSQRKECGCMESIDIGKYDTCMRGCRYCYASNTKTKLVQNITKYDVNSPILCDELKPEDIITERKMKSLRRKK